MSRTGWLEELTHDTVIVHLRDRDESIKGVLSGVHSDCLVVRDPIMLAGEDDQTVLAGTVIVLRESVDFMQVV